MTPHNTSVILVHGGDSSGKREYLSPPLYSLNDLDKFSETQDYCWNLYFKHEIKKYGFQSIYLRMPQSCDAIYREWEESFEYVLNQLTTLELILVGHSLGGNFLQIFLARKTLRFHLAQLYFVAPCLSEGDFHYDPNWQNITAQCSNIHVWHSKDDKVVPYEDGEFYRKNLGATMHTFTDRGHFTESIFPELIYGILEK
jgi:predicted alpha/beta hydrolase family esterase